ncbi:AaceriAFR121Wp [[Ashbya] aceris (nom. inval.)]|nr:AaceriAFR121Wp [[Ashbya] aceris (nom. inval.)]
MFVDYSSKGANKITNRIFAEKLLDLFFLDTLDDAQVLEFVKGRILGNQFMQRLTLDDIHGNRYWLYYILGLKISNEQMEEALDELVASRLLYQVEFTFPDCSFEDAYEMKESDPMRKVVVDLYISSIFLKCKINSYVKEFTKLVTSDKKMMMLLSREERLLAFSQYFEDEQHEFDSLVVILPVKFPRAYLSLLEEDGTMRTNIRLQFKKWELADRCLLYSKNVHIRDIVARDQDVQLRWIPNDEILTPRLRQSGDIEHSETSIMLRDIHKRHIERQKVMKSVNEKMASAGEYTSSEPKPEFLKIFDEINEELEHAMENDEKVINKTQEIRHRVKNGSIVLPSEIEYLRDPSTHDILKPINTNQVQHSLGKLNFDSDCVFECENTRDFTIERETSYRTPVKDPVQHYPDAVMTYRNVAYVPASNNLEAPDIMLRLSCRRSNSTVRKKLAGIVRSPFAKKESAMYLDDGSMMPESFSKLSFRFFLKAKFRKIKQDWRYYKNVAKQCMDDFRSPSAGIIIPPRSAALLQEPVQLLSQARNNSKFVEHKNRSVAGISTLE